jgi:hypothetical protein
MNPNWALEVQQKQPHKITRVLKKDANFSSMFFKKKIYERNARQKTGLHSSTK